MNFIKNNVLALVALVVAIIALVIVYGLTGKQLAPAASFGAAVVTPTNFNNLTLSNQLITGGADVRADGLASSTNNILGLTDLLGNTTIIENSATGTAYTLNLPATSTLSSFLPHQGDYASFIIFNASSTGPNVTVASSLDSSVVLQLATTSAVILPGKSATVDMFRSASSGGVIYALLSSGK